jgi:hypothetical protein
MEKSRIRAELFRCAIEGSFPTYTEFFNRIRPGTKMGSFPYNTHFDKIAEEERGLGYPDITFVVRGKGDLPNKINFQSADVPNSEQLKKLRDDTDKIIELYCPPGTQNPYR